MRDYYKVQEIFDRYGVNPTQRATASNTSIKASTAAKKKSLAGYAAHPIAQKVYEQFGVLLDAKRVWRILRNKTYKGVRCGIPKRLPI